MKTIVIKHLKPKISLGLILRLSIMYAAVAVFAYVFNFRERSLSERPDEWAMFGDYLGGVLNPMLTLLNLYLVWYLTAFVSEQDKKSLINEFRYSAYKEFIELLHSFEPKKAKINNVEEFIQKFKMLMLSNKFLFYGESEIDYAQLEGNIVDLTTNLTLYLKGKQDILDDPLISDALKFDKAYKFDEQHLTLYYYTCSRISEYKEELISFMQKILIDEDVNPHIIKLLSIREDK